MSWSARKCGGPRVIILHGDTLLQPHDMLVIAMEGEAREMVAHGYRVNVDDVPAFVSLIGIQIYRQRLNFRLRL